jgi:hypothetical protein
MRLVLHWELERMLAVHHLSSCSGTSGFVRALRHSWTGDKRRVASADSHSAFRDDLVDPVPGDLVDDVSSEPLFDVTNESDVVRLFAAVVRGWFAFQELRCGWSWGSLLGVLGLIGSTSTTSCMVRIQWVVLFRIRVSTWTLLVKSLAGLLDHPIHVSRQVAVVVASKVSNARSSTDVVWS